MIENKSTGIEETLKASETPTITNPPTAVGPNDETLELHDEQTKAITGGVVNSFLKFSPDDVAGKMGKM